MVTESFEPFITPPWKRWALVAISAAIMLGAWAGYRILEPDVRAIEIFTFIGIVIAIIAGFCWLFNAWKCENKLSRAVPAIQSLVFLLLGIWIALFICKKISVSGTVIFVIITFSLYVLQDSIVIMGCPQTPEPFKESVKLSFWCVDLPSCSSVVIFAVLCFWLLERAEVIDKDIEIYCNGGLAFLVILSTLSSVVGVPEFYWPPSKTDKKHEMAESVSEGTGDVAY